MLARPGFTGFSVKLMAVSSGFQLFFTTKPHVKKKKETKKLLVVSQTQLNQGSNYKSFGALNQILFSSLTILIRNENLKEVDA